MGIQRCSMRFTVFVLALAVVVDVVAVVIFLQRALPCLQGYLLQLVHQQYGKALLRDGAAYVEGQMLLAPVLTGTVAAFDVAAAALACIDPGSAKRSSGTHEVQMG